jgi:hypothetical protein
MEEETVYQIFFSSLLYAVQSPLFSCAPYLCQHLLQFLIVFQRVYRSQHPSNCGFYTHRFSLSVIPVLTDITINSHQNSLCSCMWLFEKMRTVRESVMNWWCGTTARKHIHTHFKLLHYRIVVQWNSNLFENRQTVAQTVWPSMGPLTVVLPKIPLFSDVMPCCQVSSSHHFGGSECLYIYSQAV